MATEGYKARSAGMTQYQKDQYAQGMAAGSGLLLTGDAHVAAGASRITLGDQQMAAGEVRYANGQYLLAADCWDCPPNTAGIPIGALQHYNHACNDYQWAADCYYNAKLQFVYAWSQTNPP